MKIDVAKQRIFLPKLDWMRYRNSRELLGKVKNITISQSCGKWYANIQTEREAEQSFPQGGAVGIDMGNHPIFHAFRWYVLQTAQQLQAA